MRLTGAALYERKLGFMVSRSKLWSFSGVGLEGCVLWDSGTAVLGRHSDVRKIRDTEHSSSAISETKVATRTCPEQTQTAPTAKLVLGDCRA